MDESHRIRQALKNPLVTVGLCLIAGFAIHNNMKNTISDPSEKIHREREQFFPPSVLPSSTNEPTPDTHRVQWIENPDRDPFAPVSPAAQPSLEPGSTHDTHSVIEHPQVQDELVLRAVAVDRGQRSAVINRTVVYEGEMINGYRILSIGPTGVWLKHHNNRRWVTFSEKPALALASQ
jgi:hypothetical protein